MCLQLREALRTQSLSLHRDFFSLSMATTEILKMVRDELVRYSIITEPAKTLFGVQRKTYSGKSGNMNDDAAIVIQLALSALREFNTSEKYSRFVWRYHQFT